jgi:hypothetical protein
MCQEPPHLLETFNNVEQILAFMQEPRKILKHLTCCWDVSDLSAGSCSASFAAFSQTVGTKERISARWLQMQLLLKNVSVEDFQNVPDRQRFLAWVVYATLGGAFHVPPSQAVDLEALKQMGQEVAVVFIFMHFPTLFPGSPQTLLGPGDESHECFNGFRVHDPREDGYKPRHGHNVWELGKLMLGPEAWKTVIAMDLIPLSFFANAGQCCGFDGEDSTCDDFWMSLPSSFHAWYVDNTLSLLNYIAKASSKSPSCHRTTMVVGTGRGCKEILSSEQYKRLATLYGVANPHPRNTASDGRSRVTWTPHFSCLTRRQMWLKMTAGESSGAALLAQLVVFAQSVGGSERGEIVRHALGALIKGKNTGTLEGDVIVDYVRCCWDRGSRFGGMGGQAMWNFEYLLLLTKRPASSFCQDPTFKAILARPKYRQGGHGKETDEDVDVGQGDHLATSAFLELFMQKVKRLEKASEKTRWKKGTSGSEKTQWEKGESGSKKNQWKKGQSGNKATQWKSCGRYGVKGKAETYASMTALAKAIGRDQSSMSKALKLAKEKTPSSALRVHFKYARLELFWDKESRVGESAEEEEEEEEEAT